MWDMEQTHQKGLRGVKAEQHNKYKKRLRELVWFNPKKRRLRGDLVAVFKYILIEDID